MITGEKPGNISFVTNSTFLHPFIFLLKESKKYFISEKPKNIYLFVKEKLTYFEFFDI
jgi:hypothetical protein